MFQGSMVAMVTPMHPDTEVDFRAMERLMAESGTQSVHDAFSAITRGERE